MILIMRLTNIIIGLIVILFGTLSCKDKFSVDLSDREFVRLDKQNVAITVGEKYTIRATLDTLGSASKALTWSVLDPEVASIASSDQHTAIITGLREGKTIVKVESSDGSIQYFSDLTVGRDRVIKILAIGNSFSEDAVENYLHDLAVAAGHNVLIANMYIGGQSLEGHWENASQNRAAYQLRAIATDGSVNIINERTLMEVIAGENWDYISFQEVSQQSGQIDGYRDYLGNLVDYAKALTTNPEVKFVLHQTWAYAEDSNHAGFDNYDRDQQKMYDAIVDAVWQAKDLVGMDMVIPAGTAIQNARTSYIGDSFTRDGYHLSLGAGRFTAAATWFEAIFGNVLANPFVPANFSEYDANLVKTAAAAAVGAPQQISVLAEFLYPEPNDFDLTAPIFIDFGGVNSPAPFNNFRHPNDQKLSNLADALGNNSNFAIEVGQPFSGTLDRTLYNVLGMPMTASQDMFFTDGIHIGQSSLVVSNLNTAKKYSFVFYGAITDDQTETQFDVIGKNNGMGLLDNDFNMGKLVVIRDIEPLDNGTVTITMSPGPNNNQWARFFGVNAMMILPEGMDVPVASNTFELTQPVFVDFGTIVAGAPFNHFDALHGQPVFDLVDASGTNTNFAMNVTDRFVEQNQFGVFNNTLGLPGSVTQDSYYGDRNNATAGFTLYNLNKDQTYQFVLYGSRDGAADNREARYVVKGATEGTALLNASSNASNAAVIGGIKPAADGTIEIIASPGPNNDNGDRFYYINALIITPDGFILPGM